MNIKRVIKYIGIMMMLLAVLMVFPFICGLIYRESSTKYFIIVAIPLLIIGLILSRIFDDDDKFYSAEGFATVSLGWVVLSIFGALPFYLSGEIPNVIDAIFETVSGFSTTGASIVPDVGKLSKCMNFWRCFTHFVGGMGVLVLMIAIIPTASENFQILKAESPGPQVGKLVSKVSETAKVLYIIYVFLTFVAIVSFKISGMPLYDSICIGLGTAGTGGFTVTTGGCSDYGTVSRWLITIFMFIFGVNFNIYYLVLQKKFDYVFKSEEFIIYTTIVFVSAFMIMLNIKNCYENLTDVILHSFFHVTSVITTTGFSIFDIAKWPMFSQSILLALMICGGCAGSTAGGFKVARVIMLIKSSINEFYLQLHPNSIKVVRFEDKVMSQDTIRTLNSYTIIYILIIAVAVIIISIENINYETIFVSVIATFNNVGLGISQMGPTENFSIFTPLSKIVFILLMLIGRLEIFPVLILLSRSTWNREV